MHSWFKVAPHNECLAWKQHFHKNIKAQALTWVPFFSFVLRFNYFIKFHFDVHFWSVLILILIPILRSFVTLSSKSFSFQHCSYSCFDVALSHFATTSFFIYSIHSYFNIIFTHEWNSNLSNSPCFALPLFLFQHDFFSSWYFLPSPLFHVGVVV